MLPFVKRFLMQATDKPPSDRGPTCYGDYPSLQDHYRISIELTTKKSATF